MPSFCKIILPCLLLSVAVQPVDRASACGPFFPPSTLDGGDKALLAAPIADFAHEVVRLLPRPPAQPVLSAFAQIPDGQTLSDAADVADVLAATKDRGLAHDLQAWRKTLRAASTKENPLPLPGNPPQDLPPEFLLYENGALCYHRGDLVAARAQWQKLLDLPEKDRRQRTLWATYMIGRSYVDADPAMAAKWLTQCRQLAKPAGQFDDPLHFAAASLGWQAKVLWKQNQEIPALHLYFEQVAAGDPTAVWSLRDSAASLLASDQETLTQAARDPIARQIVTIYLISDGGVFSSSSAPERDKNARTWLHILESLSLHNVAGADRLAWAAYKSDQMKLAQRWLNVAEKDGHVTPAAQWIQAKLDLRNGAVDQAAACLANAAKTFPVDENWTDRIEDGEEDWRPAAYVAGELAALKLGRGNYTQSLDLLFRAAWWWDAAYVAERVLTVDELKAYVDKDWPPGSKSSPPFVPPGPPRYSVTDNYLGAHPYLSDPDPAKLRDLLARRLARLGRLQEARPYFDPSTQKIFDAYVADLHAGQDKTRPSLERGRALFAAARIARHNGLQILGTECAPDEARLDGNFQIDPLNQTRAIAQSQKNETLAPNLPRELKHTAANVPVPNVRWHYRYIATDLAWQASLLMPNDTIELRDLLDEAAGWIKVRDPKAADRFYKAIYKRCPNLP